MVINIFLNSCFFNVLGDIMNIVGTHLKKMLFQRNEFDKPVKLGKISNNVEIVDVTEREYPSGKGLTFEFRFKTTYSLEKPKDKKLGEIEIMGDIIVMASDKDRKDTIKSWKKKQIDPKTMENILNIALEASQIEAVASAKKILLPNPVRLPRFRISNKGQGA